MFSKVKNYFLSIRTKLELVGGIVIAFLLALVGYERKKAAVAEAKSEYLSKDNALQQQQSQDQQRIIQEQQTLSEEQKQQMTPEQLQEFLRKNT